MKNYSCAFKGDDGTMSCVLAARNEDEAAEIFVADGEDWGVSEVVVIVHDTETGEGGPIPVDVPGRLQ